MAREIRLRLYEELNDLLPPDKRKLRFGYPLRHIRVVKELLSSLAVPEKDVELVLVNSVSVDGDFPLHDGDSVSIYPVFEALDVRPLIRLRKQPLRRTRFVAGAGLVRLTGYLLRLGFDTLNSRSWSLPKTVQVAEEERRILLTRDPSSLQSLELSRIYFVQAARPGDQLLEVLSRFDLFDAVHFSGTQLALARILKSSAGSK